MHKGMNFKEKFEIYILIGSIQKVEYRVVVLILWFFEKIRK